jgi:hypothetical protein
MWISQVDAAMGSENLKEGARRIRVPGRFDAVGL